MTHRCEQSFPTRKIDSCCGIGLNVCHGEDQMILETSFENRDGQESAFDNWTFFRVNYCPFCGLEAMAKYALVPEDK